MPETHETDDTAGSRHDGFADVINLLATPIAGGIRTVEQFKRGVEELFRAVENVNRTMENLNEAATRINRFLAEIEGPVSTLLPQVSRTVKTVDEIAGKLGAPAIMALPGQLADLVQRLGPLAALAENAGGLFGGFRRPAPAASKPAEPVEQPGAKQPAAKKPAAKKPAKQPASKRSS
jgi:ABC-type transporter Mla subunit MlaD